MLKVKGYSIWCIPDEGSELYITLQRHVADLSLRFDAPIFDPHVTLIGWLKGDTDEIVEKTMHLARQTKPFEIRLNGIGLTNDPLKCLYIGVQPSSELQDANALARKIFGKKDRIPYAPHLSLLYGDFPRKDREEAARDIRDVDASFAVSQFHLYDTNDEPLQWHRTARIPLTV